MMLKAEIDWRKMFLLQGMAKCRSRYDGDLSANQLNAEAPTRLVML